MAPHQSPRHHDPRLPAQLATYDGNSIKPVLSATKKRSATTFDDDTEESMAKRVKDRATGSSLQESSTSSPACGLAPSSFYTDSVITEVAEDQDIVIWAMVADHMRDKDGEGEQDEENDTDEEDVDGSQDEPLVTMENEISDGDNILNGHDILTAMASEEGLEIQVWPDSESIQDVDNTIHESIVSHFPHTSSPKPPKIPEDNDPDQESEDVGLAFPISTQPDNVAAAESQPPLTNSQALRTSGRSESYPEVESAATIVLGLPDTTVTRGNEAKGRKKKTKAQKKAEKAEKAAAADAHARGEGIGAHIHELGAHTDCEPLLANQVIERSVTQHSEQREEGLSTPKLDMQQELDKGADVETPRKTGFDLIAPKREVLLEGDDADAFQYYSHIVFESEPCPDQWKFSEFLTDDQRIQWTHEQEDTHRKTVDGGRAKKKYTSNGWHMNPESVYERTSAAEKLVKWWESNTVRRDKVLRDKPRHITLIMGQPLGPFGEAVKWAEKIDKLGDFIKKGRMKSSRFLIKTEVHWHEFASRGCYTQYMQAIKKLQLDYPGRVGVEITDDSILTTGYAAEFYDHRTLGETIEQAFQEAFQTEGLNQDEFLCRLEGKTTEAMRKITNYNENEYKVQLARMRNEFWEMKRKNYEAARAKVVMFLKECRQFVEDMQYFQREKQLPHRYDEVIQRRCGTRGGDSGKAPKANQPRNR